jgi:acyl carrier protein
MTQCVLSLEQTVLAAIDAASIDKTVPVTPATEVLTVIDSLGFFTALTAIQEAMGLAFEPQQLLQLFRCRSVGDLIDVLAEF